MAILGLSKQPGIRYPAHFDIEAIIRPNVLACHPYRCARDDYQDGILLDANENSLGSSIAPSSTPNLDLDLGGLNLHRYPDPAQIEIKQRIATLRNITGPDHVFLGVGSDEVIDLLMRVFIVPGREHIMTTPPTYGMYAVCAQINDAGVVKVPLDATGGAFRPRIKEMKEAIDQNPSIKLIFLCSPGNPTGTLIPLEDVQELLEYPNFKGVVVVDEAYIDFARQGTSAVPLVTKYANLCVLQTLSKSFGLAAIRIGIAIAQPPLIQILTNIKAPYNISTPTSVLAISALSEPSLQEMRSKVATLVCSRDKLLQSLSALAPLGMGMSIGANDANFVLVPVLNRENGEPDNDRSQKVYKEMAEKNGVVVRYRGGEHGCKGCLRITVGSEEENKILIEKLTEVLEKTTS